MTYEWHIWEINPYRTGSKNCTKMRGSVASLRVFADGLCIGLSTDMGATWYIQKFGTI